MKKMNGFDANTHRLWRTIFNPFVDYGAVLAAASEWASREITVVESTVLRTTMPRFMFNVVEEYNQIVRTAEQMEAILINRCGK